MERTATNLHSLYVSVTVPQTMVAHAPFSDCQLEAIKQTKVDMSVYLGNYPDATDNNTAYNRQRGELQSVLQTYGTDHVSGMTVGNEFMLK